MTRLLALWILLLAFAVKAKETSLSFVCSSTNDLFVVAKQSGLRSKRFETAAAAVEKAAPDSAVLLLAENYPAGRTTIDPKVYELSRRKNLRLFVEYPASNALPGIRAGEPKQTEWERGVIADDIFGSDLPRLRIVAIHDCHFVPMQAENPWVVVARVAGFDTAPYGIPTNALPVLFEVPEQRLVVASTQLSRFVTARYAPTKDWKTIWEKILATLDPAHAPFQLKWEPNVAPSYTASEKLPRAFERKAFDAAAKWIGNSGLLIPASRTNQITALLSKNTETIAAPNRSEVADGKFGILEGYASGIRYDGTQLQRLPVRADCQAESAMVLGFNSLLNHDKGSRDIAGNLLDYVYFNSAICGGPRADQKNGAFGLIAWGDISPSWLVATYGDDDARTMLATIAASAAVKNGKWNEPLTKALIANFRTTGKLGFRGDRVDMPPLDKEGWKHFYNAETVNYSPHFESYLWACNLWAYRATGFRPFFDKATNAIAMTMKVYPGSWRWQDNGERSRMMLCLSWLVRLEDTPEHRQWLRLVATDLLKRQQPSGAIHEWLGGTGGGHYHIPQSNEAYGTGETPLIQKNGDPASDQLYTTGFSLLGLHEAVAATGDAELKAAEDKLVEFLCRVQIRSKTAPYLNGWWFRAFDDSRWEYWASSADIGWGPWSIEAGWAQAWTSAVLAMRSQKTSFWDLTSNVQIKNEFEKWGPTMLK